MGDNNTKWDGNVITTFNPDDDLNSEDDFKYDDDVLARRIIQRRLLSMNDETKINKRARKMVNGVFGNQRQGRTLISYQSPEYANPMITCTEEDDEEYEDYVERKIERQKRRRSRAKGTGRNKRLRRDDEGQADSEESSEDETFVLRQHKGMQEHRPVLVKEEISETIPPPAPAVLKYAWCPCHDCIKKSMLRCKDESGKKKEKPMFHKNLDSDGKRVVKWMGNLADMDANELQDSCPVCSKYFGLEGTGAKLARVSVRRYVRGYRHVAIDDDGQVRRCIGHVPVQPESIRFELFQKKRLKAFLK